MAAPALYLDTSAVLRAVLETGVSPEIEERLARRRLRTLELLTADERMRVAVSGA